MLNALLFEKLQNESKNLSFLHKVTCIRSDHTGAVAKFNIHGFETLEGFDVAHLPPDSFPF